MARNPLVDGLVRILRDVASNAVNRALHTDRRTDRRHDTQRDAPKPRRRDQRRSQEKGRAAYGYPGDYQQLPTIVYNPHRDGRPDPGEIVWTWVPYEEDHSQGKDRPVLLIGRDGDWLIGLQVTSQDHDRDRGQEERAGRYWFDIGTGEWDNQRRESEVRVNRLIRVDPDAVRRVGAILDKRIFDDVAREVARHY